jgi:hypothetical protein
LRGGQGLGFPQNQMGVGSCQVKSGPIRFKIAPGSPLTVNSSMRERDPRWAMPFQKLLNSLKWYGVLGALAVGWVAYSHDKSQASTRDGGQSASLNATVQYKENAFMGMVTLASHEDDPFTVNRIIINKRKGQRGCDFDTQDSKLPPDDPILYRSPLPVTLRFAEQLNMLYALACDSPIFIELYTDRGYVSYTLEPYRN